MVGAICGLGPGEAGDIATEPRTIDAIAALPAGLSVSGRVGEGEWYGPGPCPGGYWLPGRAVCDTADVGVRRGATCSGGMV